MTTNSTGGRRVVANIGLTLDGCYQGPQGRGDVPDLQESGAGMDQIVETIRTATTAVLGRVNGEGFLRYWPTVIGTGEVDPRDEAYARWFVDAEKVVLSSSLGESPWEGVRVVDAPAPEVIEELKASGEGDILINHSASVIKDLLAADAIDRFNLLIAPEVSGGGDRLFVDGLPGTRWQLMSCVSDDQGAIAATYDRRRE